MPQPANGPLERKDVGPVTVLRINTPMLRGDQDSDELFEQIGSLVENSRERKFVLDVGAIQYFASAALGKLVSLNRKARAADARLVMCNVTPSVARILQVTRLSDVLVSYDSEGEAVRSLS
jgi:anti-sigma B factor antagonist